MGSPADQTVVPNRGAENGSGAFASTGLSSSHGPHRSFLLFPSLLSLLYFYTPDHLLFPWSITAFSPPFSSFLSSRHPIPQAFSFFSFFFFSFFLLFPPPKAGERDTRWFSDGLWRTPCFHHHRRTENHGVSRELGSTPTINR